MREKLIHELEEERHLRLESENKLREVTLESERNRAQMRGLQQQFSRMEERVRNLLQNQGSLEPSGEEPVPIIKAYQETFRVQEGKRCKTVIEDTYVAVDKDSRNENSSNEEEKERTKLLLERLKALEAENSALAMENKNQREQYERCLDEVANQVVQALLTQKDLREECLKLKSRVFDLEQQNRTLSVLFQQRMKPTSGLLLQKLHSRILDLSSGDFLSEVEKNRSLIPSQSADVQIHECQQNMKSGVPALKCQSQLNMTGPSRVYPRSSCSSSELSLSSACSEYSSGSSYTWNDGKACSKRSSVNWDKRISIGSSLPSNPSSPVDDLPPTCIKENHILEGLKKLQKQKILFEPPPSVISKWGYKDCMDSNEGIYSPGIKSHKEQENCLPEEIASICIEHRKTFMYDSDSHEDADDESSTLALLYEGTSKNCRHYCNKLTHSVSDSLFGWEPDQKPLLESGSYFNSKERPEKLTSFVNEFQSEAKSGTNAKLPVLQIDKSLANVGWRDLNLHLSDTDDNEILDELHIESGDEKSPSDLSLTSFVDKHAESSDMHVTMENSHVAASEKEVNQVPPHPDSRAKPCNFVKEQKVIKKTSSEECITVIFDAEDGKPIEFSSHQMGIVTVTRNEISINHPYTQPSSENTECLPQGIVTLQKATDAQNLQRPDHEIERITLQDDLGNEHTVVPTMCNNESTVHFERPVCQNTTQQKLIKSVCRISSKASSPSCLQTNINQRQKWTKIPSRGKFSPHKMKDASAAPSHSALNLEKSPLSPVKCSRFKKVQSQNPHSKVDLPIPKVLAHPTQNSKILSRTEWPKTQHPESNALPQHLIESINCGEPPTRDVCCDFPIEPRSPSPPPPPGRSASLLVRPNYEQSPGKPKGSSPSENVKPGVKLSPRKGVSKSIFHNITMHETQTNQPPAVAKDELNHLHDNRDKIIQSNFTSEHSPGMCQATPSLCTKKLSLRTSNQSESCNNQELRSSKNVPSVCMSQNINSLQNRSLSEDTEVPQKHMNPISFLPSPDGHAAIIGEPLLPRTNRSPLLVLSHGSDTPEKGLKPHLQKGLKLLIKSPQLLRRSSTIPGKPEKDSMNAASKSCVNSKKCRQSETLSQTVTHTEDTDSRGAENETKEFFVKELEIDKPSVSLETCSSVHQGDGLDNKLVKRSFSSSNKTYLKPALGMNGAKARSQSFSIYMGEKSPVPSAEALGKVRTQIITNTSERGNSLSRQNSTIEGCQINVIPGSVTVSDALSNTAKVPENSYCRQGSCGSISSSNSQVGSPSKPPFRLSPKGDLFYSISKNEGSTSPSQRDVQSKSVHDERGSNFSKQQPVSKKCVTQAEMAVESSTSISTEQILHLQRNQDSIECSHKQKRSQTVLEETCVKASEVSEKVSTPSVLQPTIEEKVMLCIQENMQKGQGQSKSPTPEIKQKSGGPSLASWFGFRRSKLPALSGRKTDISKAKTEKKEAKSSGFGSKQTKSEKRKDRKKNETLHCEMENELNKKTMNGGILDSVPKGKKSAKATQNNVSQTRCEQKTGFAQPRSGKDSFMKELLHRVDKKAAQQTESGSNNVSYRSMSKGSSQGSSLPSNSISTQGIQKKNGKTKADMEIPNETLANAETENFQDNEEGTITDSSSQSHLIESCCQMRTLDSGIGTFPLPDSGNRSTGRHVSKQEPELENEVFTMPDQVFLPAASEKAKTLEREVPSIANKNQESVESIIIHSTSDPNMTAKGVRPFQSRLPKLASAGIMSPVKKSKQEESSLTSASLEHSEKGGNKLTFPDWSIKKAIKSKDRALRVCTYSASSSSDTETELEYETNDFVTGGGKLVNLMKSNKQAEQEENSVRKSFMGRPMSILDLYQHSLCGHYGEDGPEQLAHYSFIEQLNGTSTKDGKSKKIPSKLKQPEEPQEDSEKRLSKISQESLNKFSSNNSSSSILLEKEKNSLNKVEGQEEEDEKNEEVSLTSSDRHGIDHLESLSDSLYDSFSSCASQGSNDV